MTLRPYQLRTVAAARAAVADGCRAVCLVIPTGGGKTRTAAAVCQSAVSRGHRVLWLAHRVELLDQARDTLLSADIPAVSVLRADDPRADPSAPAVVASIPTLAARPECRPVARLVILDECHHTAAASWRSVAESYPDATLLGLTATPERSDGSPLGDIFDRLIVGATYSELLDAGHLVACDVIAPSRRLSQAVAQDPAEAYLEHGRRRPGLVFTSTVAESRACVGALRMAGVRAAHIDGGTADRSGLIAAYRAGELDVLSSCAVLTEGFDAPRAKVAVLARSCGSELTYLQIVGRVLRPDGTGPALLLDLVGAVHDHGWPTDDRAYSLTGQAIQRAGAAEVTIQRGGAYFGLPDVESTRGMRRAMRANTRGRGRSWAQACGLVQSRYPHLRKGDDGGTFAPRRVTAAALGAVRSCPNRSRSETRACAWSGSPGTSAPHQQSSPRPSGRWSGASARQGGRRIGQCTSSGRGITATLLERSASVRESDLQRSIMIATSDAVDWYRNNVGCYDANPACPHCGKRKHAGAARWIHYGVGGTGGADLIGIVRGSGTLIAAEIKTPTGRVRDEQVLFASRVRASGGLVVLARSADDVRAYLASNVAYTQQIVSSNVESFDADL